MCPHSTAVSLLSVAMGIIEFSILTDTMSSKHNAPLKEAIVMLDSLIVCRHWNLRPSDFLIHSQHFPLPEKDTK